MYNKRTIKEYDFYTYFCKKYLYLFFGVTKKISLCVYVIIDTQCELRRMVMKRTSKKIHRSKLITFRILFLCLVELSICNKNSFALDPLGSPSSELQQWQHGIGFEYSTSKADIQLINGTSIKSASSYYGNVNPRIFDSSGVEPDVATPTLHETLLHSYQLSTQYSSLY